MKGKNYDVDFNDNDDNLDRILLTHFVNNNFQNYGFYHFVGVAAH